MLFMIALSYCDPAVTDWSGEFNREQESKGSELVRGAEWSASEPVTNPSDRAFGVMEKVTAWNVL
jgi:hypothetical protein